MAYTVQCPSCSTEFPVDPAKVPEDGVNARCSACAEVFFVARPGGSDEAPGGVAALESPVEIPQEEAPAFEGSEAEGEGEEGDFDFGTPAMEEAQEEEAISEEVEEEEVGFAESPEDVEIAEEDFVLEQETLYAEGGEGVEPTAAEAGLEMEEAGLEMEEAGLETEEAELETEEAELETEEAELETEEADDEPLVEEAPGGMPAPEAETHGGEAPAGLAGTGEVSPPTGPVQFGHRSPEEKAQRLARVLVSDMILYNPQRHTRAMENGTLAEEFEDEIKKSWEEYVDQVGEELAESTSHFTDALNEILAKGEDIF